METVYHLWLQYPAGLYSTFTLREMELAVQLSCDRKKNHFIESIGKVYIWNKKKKAKSNTITVYPVLSRKPVRPDIKERYRYHSGNTLCGRTAPRHSSAPPRTPASCMHNTHHPSAGGIPSARNSGKQKRKKKQPNQDCISQVFGMCVRTVGCCGKDDVKQIMWPQTLFTKK